MGVNWSALAAVYLIIFWWIFGEAIIRAWPL